MKFTGDISVPAPRDAVYAKVRDARFFASCVEGVQELNEIDPDHYTAVLETKVAYLKFKFNVAVEVTRADPPHEIEAKIEGTPLEIVGRLTARSLTRLEEENAGTKISYEIEAALTGKLGSLGQPVLRSKAKELERQFAERMRAAFTAGGRWGFGNMTPFELAEPASLHEALALLDPDDSTVRPIAGGTALMLMMKAGVFRPTRLVSLRKLDAQYARIVAGADGTLTIGAMTPLAKVERSPEVARVAPVIPRAMRRLSNIRVRNVATIGGNLAHGDPHMDLPPVLIALGAEVAIGSPTGEHTIAVEDLFAGYFETGAGEERTDHRAAHPGSGQVACSVYKIHDRLGRGLASARRGGRSTGGRRPGGQIRARRRQRRDREGHTSQERGKRARRRDRRRRLPRARRRCRGRGGRVYLGRARLGRLQTGTASRLYRPRGAAGP